MASCRILLLLLISCAGFAQTNRYFVSFKDKANTPFSISNPTQFLTQKSLDRRSKEGFVLSGEDLPVDPHYVAQVKATGASVFYTSRWFNGVLVQMDASLEAAVSSLSCVSKLELVAYGTKLLGGRARKVESANSSSTLDNQQQLQMLGLDQMNSLGYRGEGIDVALFDAGFIGVNTTAPFQHLYNEGRIKQVKNFVDNSQDVYSAYFHGTEVLSVMAGYDAGHYEGGAYKANYYLYQTEDAYSEYRVEEYNWLFAAELADSAGVDVINASLGYNTFDDSSMDYTYQNMDGKTSVVAQAATKVLARGISVVVAAGNEGGNSWHYILTPADAKGVLAAGSVDASLNISSFSSSGPSADGRIKPDIAAMGSGTVIIQTDGSVSTNSGTSLASPLISCLSVGLRQAFPQASQKVIYDLIVNSGSLADSPNNSMGYGVPNFMVAKQLFELPDEYAVYPNPVGNSLLKIFFKNPQGQRVNLSLYDSTGKEVLLRDAIVNWDNNPIVFAFSESLASGIYFLRVQSPLSVKTTKIIKI